jgi:hypothetical protein
LEFEFDPELEFEIETELEFELEIEFEFEARLLLTIRSEFEPELMLVKEF